jgi:hypothetical protein
MGCIMSERERDGGGGGASAMIQEQVRVRSDLEWAEGYELMRRDYRRGMIGKSESHILYLCWLFERKIRESIPSLRRCLEGSAICHSATAEA